MNSWLIILSSVVYLLFLFSVAYYAERKAKTKKSIIDNPYIYALSLAVYCTAWTFFGSVGRATTTGIEFFYIYLGPILMGPLFWVVLRKIIRISKIQRITSIADFISTRYGKNVSLGVIVTLLCIVGIIPYIAIQLKAITSSIYIVTGNVQTTSSNSNFFNDSTVYIAAGLSFFIILFGTRNVDATEKHEGMVAAIAFESIIKLVAFIVAGIFVTYFIFNGIGDIMTKAKQLPALNQLFQIHNPNTYLQLLSTIVLSMMGILFLPRQFQVSVVENVKESHLKKAMWLFPLYLLIINVFVIPIAFGGTLASVGKNVNADTFVLALPMQAHKPWLTLLVYIGGFSAASSMIIVETIALSIMVSNNIVIPTLLSINAFKERLDNRISKFIIYSRRLSIVVIIFLAYLFEKLVAAKFSLVSVGMVSFVAVAQFGPAVIGGIYWKKATKKAALVSIIIGFIFWFYTLVIPSIAGAGYLNSSILTNGIFNCSLLRPLALFGLEGIDPIVHGFFWSMFFNAACFIGISLYSRQSSAEVYLAEIFVDVYKYSSSSAEGSTVWKGTAYIPDLKSLLSNFIGKEKAYSLLEAYATKRNINLKGTGKAEPMLVSFAEKILAGAIGSASARIMVKRVVKEEELSIDEVLNILRESQSIKETNKELRRKSIELSKATEDLRKANFQLKQIDEMKDEFLYTVTHELRTPLTSIRALSEIIYDNDDLPDVQKANYLEAIIKETERLSHLITQVLNLERYESGRAKLSIAEIDVASLLHATIESAQPLIAAKKIHILTNLQSLMPPLQGDSDLLSQVFYNLVSNAIKHTHQTIDVTASFTNNVFTISIKDDGEGIAEELHELIFDKFFQAKNQTLKKPEGSGLGLAICKRIVEMHQGKIWVESSLGNGACFLVELPINNSKL